MNKVSHLGRVSGVLLLTLLMGCTSYYRKSADREAYKVIQQKSPFVKNMDPDFTIEQTNANPLAELPHREGTNDLEFLGDDGTREVGATILTLNDALDIAIHHSRSYQSRKEQLYISALSLTLARHQFTPLFSSGLDGTYQAQSVPEVVESIDAVTGDKTIITTGRLIQDHSVSSGGSINADLLIRDVGRLTTAFTADFTRFVTGDPGVTTSSQLSAQFLRPLLQDAGYKSDTENLIQAERQLVYDLRDFTQARKDFIVQIATAYYRVLGNRDAARNSYLNWEASKKNAERSRAQAEVGRVPQAELGRNAQQELSAESTWVGAIRTYEQALDDFKIQLGLSVDDNIVLDDRELERLTIEHPDISVEDSIKVALAARLDYQNTKDELEDAVRKVDLRANLLLPRVDLTGRVNVPSDPSDNTGFPLPDPDRYNWSAGLVVDPGLDRKSQRNAYRTALITRNRAARAVEQQEDEIKLQVRNSWRTLDQAKRDYEINKIGVDLAERRVEEQNLRAELGSARAQDQVDAQNALISSKNQLTQALVNHTIARLQFWNNMGILYIKDNGQWEDMQNASIQ